MLDNKQKPYKKNQINLLEIFLLSNKYDLPDK